MVERSDLDRARERGQMLRRSAFWNVAHALDDASPPVGSQTIQRSLVLLNLVGVMARDRPKGVSLADLSRVSGRPKPSVHRVMAALAQAGYVDRDAETGCYRLGIQAQILGELAEQRVDPLTRAAAGSLVRLAELSEDTAFVTARQGSYALCTRREEGSGLIRNFALAVGDRHPLGVGAGSLAILSALDDDDVEATLTANVDVLQRHYPLIDVDILKRLVARTREWGYALNDGFAAPGSWAIGVVLRDAMGQPVAALSIASIEERLSGARRQELVEAMHRETKIIEATSTRQDRARR